MNKIIHLVPSKLSENTQKQKVRARNTMPDGRKRIRIDLGKDPETGKHKTKAFYGRTLKECRDKRDTWIAAQKAQTDEPTPKTVREWAGTWRAVYGSDAGYSQNRTVEIDVRRLCDYMGNMLLSDVQQVHIQSYATSVSGKSKSTVDKIKRTTNRIFKAAFANGLIKNTPWAEVKWKYASKGGHRNLEGWEIDLITNNYDQHFAGTWAMLMLYAGLRRGEALALRWEDVDFEAGEIHVKHGIHFENNTPVLGNPKTENAVRDVPISPQLEKALRETPRTCDYVCTGAAGQQVTESIWARGWKAWNNTMRNILNGDTKTPISPGHRTDRESPDRKPFEVRAHDLRHTFATLLYDAGVDVKTAQVLLGHATPEITMSIYTHLTEEKKASSLGNFKAYFSDMWLKSGSNL